MAAREEYVRTCTSLGLMECTVGVETRPDDDIHQLIHFERYYAQEALHRHRLNHRLIVMEVEANIKSRWPGRAYFIETEEMGGGLQVYQPWGMPRTEAT